MLFQKVNISLIWPLKYLKISFLVVGLKMLCYSFLFAQTTSPTPEFFIPENACLNENLVINNKSVNADSYFWDFCVSTFSDEFKEIFSSSITAGNRNLGIDFINQYGIWYGIATNYGNNKIYRLTFGNGLSSAPTKVTDLGNVGGLLNQPVSIKLVEQEDSVYALVHNLLLFHTRYHTGL